MIRGYTLQFKDTNKKFYCLKEGQTRKFVLFFFKIVALNIVKERLEILDTHMHKPDAA